MELRAHRHSTVGFSLPLPAGWEAAENLHGTALIAVEPPRPPYFRANLNVTIEEAPAGAELDDWVRRSLGQLDRVTDRLYLIDREPTEVDGLPAIRSLSHHVDPEHGGLALEQWTLLAGPYAYVVSASTTAAEYDERHEFMSRVAEGFVAPREPEP